MNTDFTFSPIGVLQSCYRDKFGIPRQPGLVKCATATLKLSAPYNTPDALRGLESFSHIWVLFVFHQTLRTEWKPTVRPPRLGGNERIGVFASRSNFRPNPIGLSVVELLAVEGTQLLVGGGDFLDQTPVLDIKPYVPYADSLPHADGAFAAIAPAAVNKVSFSPDASRTATLLEDNDRPALCQIISDMLAFNPRPAYQQDDPNRVYATHLFDIEVRWKHADGQITVINIETT